MDVNNNNMNNNEFNRPGDYRKLSGITNRSNLTPSRPRSAKIGASSCTEEMPEMIEITEACEAIPYRYKRRLKTVKIPAGAILHATAEEVSTHIPRRWKVDPERGYGRVWVEVWDTKQLTYGGVVTL